MRAVGRTDDEGLRELAIERLKKKREFTGHLMAYVLVNTMLVVIWAVTGAHFFWPVFPILGWGIGLFFHAWDVYSVQEITEERVEREMERLRKAG
jgi:uncharacterized membrane protein